MIHVAKLFNIKVVPIYTSTEVYERKQENVLSFLQFEHGPMKIYTMVNRACAKDKLLKYIFKIKLRKTSLN